VNAVAGAFCILLGVGLLFGYLSVRNDDPLNSTQLKAYKDSLRSNPNDQQLKAQIRKLDLQLRQRYFTHLTQGSTGVYLLLGGVAVLIFSATRLAQLGQKLPLPQKRGAENGAPVPTKQLARWSVAVSGASVAIFLFVLSLTLGEALPNRSIDSKKSLASDGARLLTSDAASLAELKQNWPRFRGFDGGGLSITSNAPVSWDAKTGAGISWKAIVPAPGFNSPIVWGNHVFILGADTNLRSAFCYDANSGQLLWQQAIAAASTAPQTPPAAIVPLASATMATDGRRVYAFFGDGMLAALSLEGRLIWSKKLGPLRNGYGHAASLLTWQDRLILQLDQGEPEEGKSKLYAIAGQTGEILWQRPRKVGSSWASPLIIEAAAKTQIITLAVPWIIAYSATDGVELWRVEGLNGEITPSPLFAAGLVFVISPSEKVLAIRPDGTGDVTKTHIAWSSEQNVPDITSPASDGELLFTLSSPGTLSCYDAKDGKKNWQHDFELEFHSSPSIAAGRLYLFSLNGTAIIVQAARQFKELFRTSMPDAFSASPAFAPGKIFMRGETNLWCIGSSEPKLTQR
jgi:outer membrane protein assembly factor BamB